PAPPAWGGRQGLCGPTLTRAPSLAPHRGGDPDPNGRAASAGVRPCGVSGTQPSGALVQPLEAVPAHCDPLREARGQLPCHAPPRRHPHLDRRLCRHALATIIARATTRDGSVVETGELRAFRENLQLAQM